MSSEVYNDDNDYEEWFNIQKAEAERQFREFNNYQTQNFDDIVNKYSPKLIKLKGDAYNIATKMVFYSVLSNQLKHNNLVLNNQKTDLRIPLMIIMKAGHGKKNYVSFISRTIKDLKLKYVSPTSFHPEQFLGKILVKDKGKNGYEYNPVYGTLATDLLLIDDAHLLLKSKDPIYQESLRNIRTALDSIGRNEVEKKQVNVPYNERLHYYPTCNIILLSQPIQIDEELVNRGSFRRFVIVKVDSTIQQHSDSRRQLKPTLSNTDQDDVYWKNWIDINLSLMSRKDLKFHITDQNFELIDEYIDQLVNDILSKTSKEAIEYLDNLQMDLKYFLYRMAIIRAIVETLTGQDVIEIEKHHIESAIEDHKQLWPEQIAWICQQMELTSDKPHGWKDDVHGWILQKVNNNDGDMYKSELVDHYLEKYKGSYAVPTLKTYIYRGLNKLYQWNMLEEYIETPANDKKLRIIEKQ